MKLLLSVLMAFAVSSPLAYAGRGNSATAVHGENTKSCKNAARLKNVNTRDSNTAVKATAAKARRKAQVNKAVGEG